MKRVDYQRAREEFYNVMVSDNAQVWRQLGMWTGPQEYRVLGSATIAYVHVIGHDNDFVWQLRDKYRMTSNSELRLIFGAEVMVRFVPQKITWFSPDLNDDRDAYVLVT